MGLTDVLDLVGMLLLVAAGAVLAGAVAMPAGLAVAGVGLLAVSLLIDARRGAAQRKRTGGRS